MALHRPNGRKWYRPLMGVTVLLGSSAMACGGMASDRPEGKDSALDLGATRQALGMYGSMYRNFPSGTVPYCYQPSIVSDGPQPGSSDYEQTTQMVEDAVAKYEAIPDAYIRFVGGDLCPDWTNYVVGT